MTSAATPRKVNLAEKFARFDDHWAPRIAGRYNSNEIRLAKAAGDFQWHSHADTDEMFIVIEGTLRMEFRDHVETLGPSEFIVVPRGVEHFPRVPEGEAKLVIIDPADTANTGDPATAYRPTDI
ncbi:cupin domain-containing protein [Pseudoblastomonas halimionae]|uniref:Cupin domain-containing protein n=1 Tax=Alteriqipengyuania halimionae TaxID=1926630 RepID=A0A6I4U845_9SPHN|nr:cupin domain-containing protein [Alteriqipengyuania halimionae]MXP10541.1 cupin domain-containing protein [Alteriqipengyuania halimionae]